MQMSSRIDAARLTSRTVFVRDVTYEHLQICRRAVRDRHRCSRTPQLPRRQPTPPQDAQNPPQPPPTFEDTVQVTATRFGEPVAEVPGSISVVTGNEIRARGATDLRTALALLGGVSVAPGGDAGPAGAVPGLLGVREVDDLLLLIDGIPAGGAFIPQVEAISLNNVERIEVMRGAAPVYYGTTAFAGTINVIHYAAGSADKVTGFHFGSYNQAALAAQRYCPPAACGNRSVPS